MMLATFAVIFALTAEPQDSTPQDMYVACYLALRSDDARVNSAAPYGPSTCTSAAFLAIAAAEGDRLDREVSFCVPSGDPLARADLTRAMAANYVRFFERSSHHLLAMPSQLDDGFIAYLYAQSEAWPCSSPPQ